VALGLVLGGLPWLCLVVLAVFEGVSQHVFSLSVVGGHIRLLVAIPLFFLCETALAPRLAQLGQMLVRSEIIPPSDVPAFASEVARLNRWKDRWVAEAAFLVLAVLFAVIAPQLSLWGATATFDPDHFGVTGTLAGAWYWAVCLTLFRFLMLRWIWRLGLWYHFLWRLSRMKLRLLATHPDNAAGLGYLEVVHSQFVPLVFAISALQAGFLAEELAVGSMEFETIFPVLTLILVMDALLFLAPLFVFSFKLWTCRAQGLSDYMGFAERYVNEFDRKWLRNSAPKEPLLGTPDLQSLADLSNSVNNVRNMRLVPISPRLLTNYLVAAILPLMPLLLFQYPATELATKFITRLTGM
jgi:hypothetical protein